MFICVWVLIWLHHVPEHRYFFFLLHGIDWVWFGFALVRWLAVEVDSGFSSVRCWTFQYSYATHASDPVDACVNVVQRWDSVRWIHGETGASPGGSRWSWLVHSRWRWGWFTVDGAQRATAWSAVCKHCPGLSSKNLRIRSVERTQNLNLVSWDLS